MNYKQMENTNMKNWREVLSYEEPAPDVSVESVRRCMAGDDNGDKKFHFWSVLTGKKCVSYPSGELVFDQQCPLHGGRNTVKDALAVGIPERLAEICLRGTGTRR